MSAAAPILSDLALQALADAADWAALRARVGDCLSALGVSDFMLRLDAVRPHAGDCLLGTLAEPLLQVLGNRARAPTDPVDQQLQGAAIPLAWQPALLPACLAYQLLAKSGVRHGLSLLMRGAHTVSRIDFYSRGPAPFATSCAQRAQFVLLGAYMHRRAETLLQQKPAALPQLSKREKECIQWSAAGKTCAEIGLILGIERRTAYFHLSNVAAKLQVYSTRHAVSRAAQLGLLE